MRNSRKTTRPTGTAVAVIEPAGMEVALPGDLEEASRDYALKSRAPRTLQEYAKIWRAFAAWCEEHRRQSLPTSIKTLGGYISWLAGRGLAISTIQINMAAVAYYHGLKGFPLDLKHPDLQAIWGGIRREIAARRVVRQVAPLEFKELRAILESRRPDAIREVLDSALLALGCTIGLRRSELVGLDYQQLGITEDKRRQGYLTIDEDGMRVVLMTSKASQDKAQTVPIPRDYAPIVCKVVEEWVAAARIEKGTPLFRTPKGRGWSASPQSPYRGVSWHTGWGKWRAQVREAGKTRALPGAYMDAYQAHLAWAKAKGVTPQPKGVPNLPPERMSVDYVPRAVRRCRLAYIRRVNGERGIKKMTEAEMVAWSKKSSGHSLRAGCATSLARAGVPVWKIMPITRHKSQETVTGYIRVVESHTESGLKGVAV